MTEVLKGIDYDDVFILPRHSNIISREDVNLESDLVGRITDRKLYPIMTSPMKGISGFDLVKAASESNILGILHRFGLQQARYEKALELANLGCDFGVAVGLDELEFAIAVDKLKPTVICVDIANGYLKSLHDFVYDLSVYAGAKIIAGNVVTRNGARDLFFAKADFVRVGIGSGNLCLTRESTGIGCPQLTALESAAEAVNYYAYKKGSFIISDGGIKSSDRIVKSFAFGADFVMIGSLFGTAIEAENDGIIYGMASRKMQEEFYGSIKSIEGRELDIDNDSKRPLKEIVKDLLYGIKSACTYLDARSYKEIKYLSTFISSGGYSQINMNGWK